MEAVSFGQVEFVPRLAAAFLMAVWFVIVILLTHLDIASRVLLVAVLGQLRVRGSSFFGSG